MIRWHLTIAAFLFGFVAVPLAAPLGLLVSDPSAWQAWAEAPRLLTLARNTFFLLAGTLVLAMPSGVAGSVLLYRTDLPGRHLWRLLMVLTLFVPLPLFTSGLANGARLRRLAAAAGVVQGDRRLADRSRVDAVGTGDRLGHLDSCRGGAALGHPACRPRVVLGRARAGGGCPDAPATVAALLACWAARGSRWFRGGVLVLMAAAWAMPGPLIGLGLKTIIDRLLTVTDSRWLAQVLYHGPSPLPLLWVDIIRFFPCAVAVLCPVARLIPTELSDAARVDGAAPAQELRRVVWPLLGTAFGRAALAVAVLSLGELSAGKLVATPGMPSYAIDIFTQMHYGVTNELAARCVLLLALVAAGGAGVALIGRRRG